MAADKASCARLLQDAGHLSLNRPNIIAGWDL